MRRPLLAALVVLVAATLVPAVAAQKEESAIEAGIEASGQATHGIEQPKGFAPVPRGGMQCRQVVQDHRVPWIVRAQALEARHLVILCE